MRDAVLLRAVELGHRAAIAGDDEERVVAESLRAARREADLILGEAHAEARKVQRDALAENERLIDETRRLKAQLRAALEIVDVVEDVLGDAERPYLVRHDRLYTRDELMEGWHPGADHSATLDGRIYEYVKAHGGRAPDMTEGLAQRLHDFFIDDADRSINKRRRSK